MWLLAYVLEHWHYGNKDVYIVSYTSMYNTLKIKVQFNLLKPTGYLIHRQV
jgi:hypothetical protein